MSKLIGYRLNGIADRETVNRTLNHPMPLWDGCGGDGGDRRHIRYFIRGHLGGSLVLRAKELGILDLWFEPIYEES